MFPGGKGGRCVGLTNLPPSCAECLEIWELQPPGTLTDCFTVAFTKIIFCAQTSMFSVLSSYVVSFWVRCLLHKMKEGKTRIYGHKI